MQSCGDRFVEVCEGLHRKTPPEMLKTSELPQWKTVHESSTVGLFSSIFSYPTTDPQIGPVLSPLYLDFDCLDSPNKAQKEATAAIKKLMQDYDITEASIAIAFSGQKGFSVTISPEVFGAEVSEHLPQIWKSIVKELVAKLKLKNIDTAIYDRRRLWRLLNTRHNKSGLFKVPLTLLELENLSIDQIKTLAANQREPFIKSEAQLSPRAHDLFDEHSEKVTMWLSARKEKFEAGKLKPTTDDPPCIKRLLESGAQKGNRNNVTFQLAVYYASKGLNQEEIEKICTQFITKSEEPLSPQEISTLVDSACKGYTEGRYSVGCSTFTDLCDKPNCPFFAIDERPNWDAIGASISFEQWRTTIQTNFPALWPYAEACASTIAVLMIQMFNLLPLFCRGCLQEGKPQP